MYFIVKGDGNTFITETDPTHMPEYKSALMGGGWSATKINEGHTLPLAEEFVWNSGQSSWEPISTLQSP